MEVNFTLKHQPYVDTITKSLKKYGIAGIDFKDKEFAAGMTYTTKDGRLFSTPLMFSENPHNELVKSATTILDLGCGVGRNLEWIMENTNAHYIGLDPNESMLQFFWDWQDDKYKNRVTLVKTLDELSNNIKFDIVVCTFVFQHLGYRAPIGAMNVGDITKQIFKFSHNNTVWIMYEHDGEEPGWIERWFDDIKKQPDVYIRNWDGITDLTDRGLHNLIIMKGIE